jgi:hypothetical protein
MKLVIRFLILFSFVASANELQNINPNNNANNCSYESACIKVYKEDQWEFLSCLMEGTNISSSSNPEKIVDFVVKTCSKIADPQSVKSCIEESGCSQL